MTESNKEKKRQNYSVPLDILYIAVVVFLVLKPAYEQYQRDAGAMNDLLQCRTNIEEISKAVDAYSKEHDGKVPNSLADLKFGKEKKLPACPSAQALKRGNSYDGRGYDYLQKTAHRPALYTVSCWGHNHYHYNIPKNQPFYSSRKGLHPTDYEIDKYRRK